MEFDREQIQKALVDYQYISQLGGGSFGRVYQVKNKNNNQQLAVKKIKCFGMTEYQKNSSLNQIRILASLNNPFIVQFNSSYFDTKQQDLYIFMQYISQGDLSTIINFAKQNHTRIDQNQIWQIIHDISKGLLYLHNNQIIHRDVKPANIFISNGKYKLGDMGISKIIANENLATTQIGTPYYTSPEIYNSNGGGYTEMCDIWSLGIIVYELCCLKIPYDVNSIEELERRQKHEKIKNIPTGYSCALNQLMHYMLNYQSKQRISAERIIKYCLQHFNRNIPKGNYSNILPKYQQHQSQIYHQKILGPIELPNTKQRWVNMVPSFIKRSGSTQQNQRHFQQINQKKSIIFLEQNLSLNIRAEQQQRRKSSSRSFRMKLPRIRRRNQSQNSLNINPKNHKTPKMNRKNIQ